MLQESDIRNKNIKVWINGELFHRDEAKVSVFDSVVQGGDAVWEGIRVYNSRIFCFYEHINRLLESAKSLDFQDIPEMKYIQEAIFKTLKANNMRDNIHIRLTLSRGKKITSGMNPKLNQFGVTLIVLAEWKKPIFSGLKLRLITASTRRNSPLSLDSKIHHANLLNNILAKIEANYAKVDDAIMLDLNGFVSETNSTNIFMIKEDVVCTPFANSCLPGITRGLIIRICFENHICLKEKDISLTELYNADGVFTTGTMGEIVDIIEIDGRKIREENKILKLIKKSFIDITSKEGVKLSF